jgi:hypothetical protein
MIQDYQLDEEGHIKEHGANKSNGMRPSSDSNNSTESSNNPAKDHHNESSSSSSIEEEEEEKEQIQAKTIIVNDVGDIINDGTDHHQYSGSHDQNDDAANANNYNAHNEGLNDTDNDCTNNDESLQDDATNHYYSSSSSSMQPITLQGILTRSHLKRRAPVGGKWNAEEDDRLREIVEEHGAKCWKNVSDEVMMMIVFILMISLVMIMRML